MSFSPEDFGKIAEEINKALQQPNYKLSISSSEMEAWVRTAISRAYYSAFLFINEKLPIPFRGTTAHKDLVNYLKSKSGLFAKIGSKLDTLRVNRIKADYRMPPDYSATLNTLNWSISILHDIMKKAKVCFP